MGVGAGVGILDEDGPRRELTSRKVPDGDALPTRVKWRADSRAARGWGRMSLHELVEAVDEAGVFLPWVRKASRLIVILSQTLALSSAVFQSSWAGPSRRPLGFQSACRTGRGHETKSCVPSKGIWGAKIFAGF